MAVKKNTVDDAYTKAPPITYVPTASIGSFSGLAGGIVGGDYTGGVIAQTGNNPTGQNIVVGLPPQNTDDGTGTQTLPQTTIQVIQGLGGKTSVAPPPVDWTTVLQDYGLTGADVAALNKIWTQSGGDANTAIPLAMSYIRTTQWYANTYPGITSGIQKGLFTDEASYRSYQNDVNQYYHQYYGRDATGDELAHYISSGMHPTQVQQVLQTGQFANSVPAGVAAMFTPEQLQAAAAQQSGQTQTAEGARMLAIIGGAGNYLSTATQYGQSLTAAQLAQFYDTGVTAAQYANQQQGTAWAKANGQDVNQATGSFGEGEMTPDQLQKLGEEQSGNDSVIGQQLQHTFNQAMQRMHGVFQGVLAPSGDFNKLLTQKLYQGNTTDVAA